MDFELNKSNQKIGKDVHNWKEVPYPEKKVMQGKSCRIEPLSINTHAKDLYNACCLDSELDLWTYLPYGPFENFESYIKWIEISCLGDEPLFYAIVDQKTNKAIGLASYLRIDPKNGSIEVGHICFSKVLSQTHSATEAMYLMMKHVFELGYRRYEWKCNALNIPSRNAAKRLGFSYEGIFRQAAVIKGKNRDTAWYAAIDSEWTEIRKALETWLDDTNFNTEGQQNRRLSDLTKNILVSDG